MKADPRDGRIGKSDDRISKDCTGRKQYGRTGRISSGKMQEYEEKKSEEVLEQNAADEKAMCVRKKYGDTWLFYIQDLYDSSSI